MKNRRCVHVVLNHPLATVEIFMKYIGWDVMRITVIVFFAKGRFVHKSAITRSDAGNEKGLQSAWQRLFHQSDLVCKKTDKTENKLREMKKLHEQVIKETLQPWFDDFGGIQGWKDVLTRCMGI